jgi:hypothetical protein
MGRPKLSNAARGPDASLMALTKPISYTRSSMSSVDAKLWVFTCAPAPNTMPFWLIR